MVFNYHLIHVLDVQYWLVKQSIQIVTKKPKQFYLKSFFHKVTVSKVYNNIIKFQWILPNSFKGIDSSSTVKCYVYILHINRISQWTLMLMLHIRQSIYLVLTNVLPTLFRMFHITFDEIITTLYNSSKGRSTRYMWNNDIFVLWNRVSSIFYKAREYCLLIFSKQHTLVH